MDKEHGHIKLVHINHNKSPFIGLTTNKNNIQGKQKERIASSEPNNFTITFVQQNQMKSTKIEHE